MRQSYRQTGHLFYGAFLAVIFTGFTPPGPEVEDGHYRDPAELAARWFPEPVVELHTPGSGEERWSTVEEAYAFLEGLAAKGPRLSVREVGESLLGIPIKALFHEAEREEALTVLVQARVHGNEPASTEGALELAYQLVHGDLAGLDINLIIVPVLNPEGARTMQRRSGTDIDPNRDYVLQNSACIRAVYRLMRETDPEVVLDMHEHRSYAWPYDLMTIGPNNPNIPREVRDFTAEAMIGGMYGAFAEAGLRLGPYRLLDFPEEGIRVRESATTFVSEKNALAMAGRVSLLTEGRGIGLGTQHFRRRTLAQYTAARAVVETAARREAEIRRLVAESRAAIAEDTAEWILRVEPVAVAGTHELLNRETLAADPVETTYWDRSGGQVVKALEVPQAYVIPAAERALADRLQRFGLVMEPVCEPVSMSVEAMIVEAFEQGTDLLYGGQMPRPDGALVRPAVRRNHDIEIRAEAVTRAFPAGSWIVRTNQPNALYLITLEPEAYSSFAALSFWGETLPEGFEFPVYRLRE